MHFGSHPSRSRPWRPPRRTPPGSTPPKKPKQFWFWDEVFEKNVTITKLCSRPTPPGVVRDGGRDGRPAGPPSPKGPFQPQRQPRVSPSHARHTLFKNCLTCLLSTNPPNKHLTPFTYRQKKINNHLKTSQTTFKTHNFSKKNSKQKPNNQTTQQPNPTKAHTQTHYKSTQPNTTITPPPLPTPHTTIRTTHRNSLGPYIYWTPER
jgi:hypothetical protein